MTKEELIKNQFPNDEFLQSAKRQIVDKCVAELEQQIEKMKCDVISERDEAKRLEDVITYTVLNNILAKWEIKEK